MYPATHMLGAQRNGLNHVSMNMGGFNRASGPVRGTNYPTYSNALLDWYQAKKVNAVRLMFTWEAVQSVLDGPVPANGPGYVDYWADLMGVVTRVLARGMYVTLAPWQFNPASGDTDIVYDGAAITAPHFADFWGKFAAAVNGVTGNDQRVGFDLMNEPHTHLESGDKPGDIGISLAGWFACAQAAVTAIRNSGAANTIFVPGMAYTAAKSFTTNGSSTEWSNLVDPQDNTAVTVHLYTGLGSASATVLGDDCSALVAWARLRGVKVHVGEIAIDAGPNGRAQFGSTFAIAQQQWAEWRRFCTANSDVVVGWNWWGNSAPGWWNQGDSFDPEGFHWGLTLDDGATQTVYMDLIESTLAVPAPIIRDNPADSGVEPNATTTVGWESSDVWVRQSADGVTVGEPIVGGQPSVVYVRVTNIGLAPSDDNLVVRLAWAKAQAGLSWPAPWDGVVPKLGGEVAPAEPVGVIQPGQSALIPFVWPDTPDPADYGGDGHFCLLATVTTLAAPAFAGFRGPDLNQNVLNSSKVAWRNLHIVPVARDAEMGNVVVANQTRQVMVARITFEVLDDGAMLVDPGRGRLVLTPDETTLEKLRQRPDDGPDLEGLGDGGFLVRDVGKGIPELDVEPGELLTIGLDYAPEGEATGYAVRVTQFDVDDGSRTPIGGQTFVAGEVLGFTVGDNY